ncbi:hypothetical protein IW137_002651, partial [Coemansia sp. RSA 1287]
RAMGGCVTWGARKSVWRCLKRGALWNPMVATSKVLSGVCPRGCAAGGCSTMDRWKSTLIMCSLTIRKARGSSSWPRRICGSKRSIQS